MLDDKDWWSWFTQTPYARLHPNHPQIADVSGEYIAKTAEEIRPRVIHYKYVADPVHPKTAREPELPFIYDPASKIVHLGSPSSYHWQLINKVPELQQQYGEAWQGQPRSEGRVHGMMQWPSKTINYYTGDMTQREEIAQALGAAPPDPIPDIEGFNFSKVAASPLALCVYTATHEHEGITISLDGHEPIKGYAYARTPATEQRVPIQEFTPEHVENYIQAHMAELQEPGKFVGTWLEKGNVCLDVIEVHEDRDIAFQRAFDGEQEAMYDIQNKEAIPVRGIGFRDQGVEEQQ